MTNPEQTRPILEVTTTAGDFRVEVHTDTAPNTSGYVLDLVEKGTYDGSGFYRSTTLNQSRQPLLQGGPLCDIICGNTDVLPELVTLEDFETTQSSGHRHVTGAVSLARDPFGSGHAVTEWFVCLDDYPDLDFGGRTEPDDLGFPVFGTVTAGIDVLRSIAARPTGADSLLDRFAGEILFEPVTIQTITVHRQ